MPFTVISFEPTPNPNAVKCWLDAVIADEPVGFRNPAVASGDPIARALFDDAGATAVLFCRDWVTVNKPPEASWSTVKRAIRRVLARVERGTAAGSGSASDPVPGDAT
jgi:hypothetical protein